MVKSFGSVQRTATALFLGIAASYMALSAGTLQGRGYNSQEMYSGLQTLALATAWLKHRPPPPMQWFMHGEIPILLDLPFLKLGKLIGLIDLVMSFEPILFTAGLVTILFL